MRYDDVSFKFHCFSTYSRLGFSNPKQTFVQIQLL